MALVDASSSSLETTTAQQEATDDTLTEPLCPPLLSRVQEPDGSDGSVYDIEILAQSPGSFKGVALRGEEPHRLAACTLIIGAPIGKNKIRMVDGKIENLWLINEETANRLDNICTMATLLGYLQTFCAGHEVPHLSCIQKSDHPAWLKDFFTVAGFNRCECLKPETGSQRFRACLKLNSSGQAIEDTPVQASSGIKEDEAKATPKQQKDVPAAPDSTVPNATETSVAVPSMNGASQPAEPSASAPIVAKPLTENQALEWLSQNKEILSPQFTNKPAAVTAPQASFADAKSNAGASIAATELTTNVETTAGAKRKRQESITESSTTALLEAQERITRSRRDDTEPGELRIKQGLADKSQQPKSILEPKPSKDPILRYSTTIASQTPKPAKSKVSQATDTNNLTDALLAQCSKPNSTKSPKQIKKEAASTSTRSTLSQPPPDGPSYHGYNMPSRSLTCYYWYNQGSCKHRDEDCIYAHHDTGSVARPPGHKKSKASSYYGQYDGAWSDVNGISVKGAHGNGSPPAGSRYDSWRP